MTNNKMMAQLVTKTATEEVHVLKVLKRKVVITKEAMVHLILLVMLLKMLVMLLVMSLTVF